MNHHNLNEALPGSTIERVRRHARGKKRKSILPRIPKPTLRFGLHDKKRNDPRKTSKGRRNLNQQSHRKRRQDAAARANPSKFAEAIEFIKNSQNQPIDVVLETATKLSDVTAAIELIDALADRGIKLNPVWLDSTKKVLQAVLEGEQYVSAPYLAIVGNTASERMALKEAQKDCSDKMKYYSTVWVERIVEGKFVRYYACGDINRNNI